ncbi:MAG: protein O-mannosyl-transferase family [Roseiflexaceae bacterium]
MHTPTRLWMPIILSLGFTTLYMLTAAPDVQAGDSAEFQLAAVTAGVPHPTTYPLYVVLTHLMTWIPFGNPAWRVTAFSAITGGISIGLMWYWLVTLGQRPLLASIGAIAFGVTPGIWNAATIAEVYTLLVLLMICLAIALQRMIVAPRTDTLAWVVCITTLGGFHHGLFVLTAAPITFIVSIWVWHTKLRSAKWHWVMLAVLVGLTPLTYPFVQFARFGPFDGNDYGLPTHYFWGAPQHWRDVVDLMTGGAVRRELFAVPDGATLIQMSVALIRRMGYEFGPIGLILIGIGGTVIATIHRRMFALTLGVVIPTITYVIAIGPGIIDWPAFTIPLLVPLTLYLTWGCSWIVARANTLNRLPPWRTSFVALTLLLATLVWGYVRYPVSAKQHLTLYREFASAVHQTLPPNAVVITHWEQGMTLQYLRYAEGLRPDVWIDVVEPGDDPWLARAQRKYSGREVFLVGGSASVESLPVTMLIDQPYADLYRLDLP